MTYVTLHGTRSYIEKGYIEDGHICIVFSSGPKNHPLDFKKSFRKDAENALTDGNYFSEEDGGIYKKEITDEDRMFIHNRYLALADMVEEQLEEKGRFDIDFLGYFEPEGADMDQCILRLRTVIENISRGCIKTEDLIKIMNALDDAGY